VYDSYELSDFALRYFDFEAFGKDERDNGNMVELEPDVWLTNAADL
jgi:hypothetical protein